MNLIASKIKELRHVLNQVVTKQIKTAVLLSLPCLWNKESQICEK